MMCGRTQLERALERLAAHLETMSREATKRKAAAPTEFICGLEAGEAMTAELAAKWLRELVAEVETAVTV